MVTPFFIIMLVVALGFMVLARATADSIMHHHHGQKASFYATHPVSPQDIVFLGDSITDGANWDELFPGVQVKNRGINGDTTLMVLERLAAITSGHPKAIFLLIGTNDLPWYEYRTDAAILETYEAILQEIKTETPETRVYVQSIFPRQRFYARRIQKLNNALHVLAERMEYTFIDVYPHLADPLGALRKGLHNDSLHLMAEGYAVWAEVLRSYMKELLTVQEAVTLEQ